MPINYTQGWSAKSLVPSLAAGPASPSSQAAVTSGMGSSLNNILASIYGPNYASLLSGGQQSGGGDVGSMLSGLANMQNASNNQSMNNWRSTAIANASQLASQVSGQQTNYSKPTPFQNPGMTNAFGYAGSNFLQQGNAQIGAGQALDAFSPIATAAAQPTPQFNTQIQAPQPAQNSGFAYNPYGTSGWVSQFQNGSQGGQMGGYANQLMGAGV